MYLILNDDTPSTAETYLVNLSNLELLPGILHDLIVMEA